MVRTSGIPARAAPAGSVPRPGRCSLAKLPRNFYDRNTVVVAKELLGKLLVHRVAGVERIGKIVEVEAYLGAHDKAAHSSKGLTPRTRAMFGPPGYAYVYFIYGRYHCMNVVTEREGKGCAVLLRALEPVANLAGRTRGPGLLTQAMQIDGRHYGHDLLSDDLFIASQGESPPRRIARSRRIGVDYAGAWARRHLRFYLPDNPFVSRR